LRDWEFEEEEVASQNYSKTFGCGYPGDQITKDWLKDHFDQVFGFPSVVRFSWKTARTILENKQALLDWHDPAVIQNQKQQEAHDAKKMLAE
jgi:ribonuclease H2 subunit A